MNTALHRASIANIPAWFKERFPAINIFSAFVMYFMVAAVGRQLAPDSIPFSLWTELAGSCGLTGFFLLMRVSDEFKDYALDSKLYPNRVLQSGQIELKHLLGVGIAAAFAMLTASFVHGGFAPWLCVLNLLLVGLLNREFFAPEWLHKHIMICALTHMLVASTSSLWVVAMTGHEIHFSWGLLAVLALPYFSGLAFEFSRKSFGTEENREQLESYTRILGVKQSVLAMFAAFFCVAIAFTAVVNCFFIERRGLALGISYPLAALALVGVLLFLRKPDKNGRKRNEALGGAYILTNYLLLIGLSHWS